MSHCLSNDLFRSTEPSLYTTCNQSMACKTQTVLSVSRETVYSAFSNMQKTFSVECVDGQFIPTSILIAIVDYFLYMECIENTEIGANSPFDFQILTATFLYARLQ